MVSNLNVNLNLKNLNRGSDALLGLLDVNGCDVTQGCELRGVHEARDCTGHIHQLQERAADCTHQGELKGEFATVN